ncbi:protein LIAT1 [Centropristis striata]|uniref:protein LIAT1 n=1 Tax=Centropristis striata TaxID=184440 RepID=UPI0027DF4AD1|nr:protein LIAT1 [Centropristis striata]
MPENKNCKLLQPSRSCDSNNNNNNNSKRKKKKKKKKRKKANASTTPPKNTDKPPAETSPASMQPPQSPGPSPVRVQLPKLRGSGRRSRKDSPAPRHRTGSSSRELSIQARESLRWEGALEDPQAEEERLELYRANRRQRYIAHRDAPIKETNGAVGQSREKKGVLH